MTARREIETDTGPVSVPGESYTTSSSTVACCR